MRQIKGEAMGKNLEVLVGLALLWVYISSKCSLLTSESGLWLLLGGNTKLFFLLFC